MSFGTVRTEVRTLLELRIATPDEQEALHKLGKIGVQTIEEVLSASLDRIRTHSRVHGEGEFTDADLAALTEYLKRRGYEPPREWTQ